MLLLNFFFRLLPMVKGIAVGKPVTAVFKHADGSTDEITLNHSLNAEQIEWFKAGSALNKLRRT